MNNPTLEDIDKIIHEPARLLIVMHLSLVEKADFLYLLAVTGLSKGNLSTHLQKLETEGYVEISKQFLGKKPQTILQLTPKGARKLLEYKITMQNLWDKL
ncbi:MAG: transcriptional regulator [Candidatus Cloacimonetes bacterium]|nr:transcriptional regulator [Candidatus Cloacimonadota bacterium]